MRFFKVVPRTLCGSSKGALRGTLFGADMKPLTGPFLGNFEGTLGLPEGTFKIILRLLLRSLGAPLWLLQGLLQGSCDDKVWLLLNHFVVSEM